MTTELGPAHLQRQLYGVGIYEEEILFSDFTGNGEKRFVVTPEQLMTFFRTGVTFRPFPGLIWMKDDGLKRKYLLTLPSGQRTILYRRQKKLTTRKLRLPNMAVQVTVGSEADQIFGINIWGFAGRQLRPDSVLYELPLPNIGGSSVCLGSTERALGDDIRQAVEKTLFDTPFNHHGDLVGKAGISFARYHKKHGGRCPLHTLNRIGRGHEIIRGNR
jgi:hypothetical protein